MFVNGVMSDFCICCLETLTEEESQYYECRCEACEKRQNERLVAWREGADDPELDKLFSAGAEG